MESILKTKETKTYELISQVQSLAAWALKYQAASKSGNTDDLQTLGSIFADVSRIDGGNSVNSGLEEPSYLSIGPTSTGIKDPFSSLKQSMRDSKGIMKASKFNTQKCNQFYQTNAMPSLRNRPQVQMVTSPRKSTEGGFSPKNRPNMMASLTKTPL